MRAFPRKFRQSQSRLDPWYDQRHWPMESCDRARYDHQISRLIACTSHHTTILPRWCDVPSNVLMYPCTSVQWYMLTPHFALLYNLDPAPHLTSFTIRIYTLLPHQTDTMPTETTNMEDLNNYNSQWVSFHIRDHLKDGEITVQNTVIEGYRSHSRGDSRNLAYSLLTPTPPAANSTPQPTAACRSMKMRSMT